jgi:hypothetical protein
LRQIHLPSAAEDHFEAGEAANKLPSLDDLLNKAFLLACFIHGDRKTAISIVARAMIKIEVAAASQGKRLYYKPMGRQWPQRSKSEGFRNKVSFNELHLLQRLIYIESEPYEIQKEQGNNSIGPEERDLVIHFIKHLVRITIKRNSFYVTLGLSRLLYHYTTSETMEIYNAVIQDPDRVKDDYYYRSRKGVLMQEMKERFGDLLKIRRGAHGEERFETHERPGQFLKTVEDSLSAFTPWWTPCLVPVTDPVTDGIPQLSYQGHQKEDQIEVNRIHAVLHPHCLRRLVGALQFESPEQSLEIPSFFFSANGSNDGGSGGLRHPAELEPHELLTLKRDLDEQRQRRKSASASLLRIVVDGVERGHLDLKRGASVDFHLERDAELIEIRARDKVGDEFLLATHLITSGDQEEKAQPQNASIILEKGQELSINISPAYEIADSVLTVKYRETTPLRTAALYFRQQAYALTNGKFAQLTWSAHPVLTTTLACILAAVFIVVGMQYVRKQTASKVPPASTGQVTVPSAEGQNNVAPTATQNSLNPARAEASQIEERQKPAVSTTAEKNRGNQSVAANPVPSDVEGVTTSEKSGSDGELTRSLETRSVALPLSRVRKIYVTFLGNSRVNEGIRTRLIENLRASNRFDVTKNRGEADALMKVSYRNSLDMRPETALVFVQLINARGDIIWPSGTSSGGNYHGSVASISRSIVEDLLRESRTLQKER